MALKLATLAAMLAGVSAEGLGELLRCGHGHDHGSAPHPEFDEGVSMVAVAADETEENPSHHHHHHHHHGHRHGEVEDFEEGHHHDHHHHHHHHGEDEVEEFEGGHHHHHHHHHGHHFGEGEDAEAELKGHGKGPCKKGKGKGKGKGKLGKGKGKGKGQNENEGETEFENAPIEWDPLDIMVEEMPTFPMPLPVVSTAEQEVGGDKLEQTFTKYKDLPLGEAALKEAGWTKHNEQCDPVLGFVWTQESSGATKSKPLKLYTTAAGQPAGVGIIVKGYGYDALPEQQQKYATTDPIVGPAPDKELAHLDVAFRQGDILCNGEASNEAIGDVLILNPKSKSGRFDLPLAESQAEAGGWHRGSCFDGMGWHWFLDQAADKGQLSGKGENLFPVVTMYDQGKINAIFFASWNNQVSIPLLKYNEWEPVPLFESAMCKNTCDEDCKFKGVSFWSTMHIYFRDHTEVTCPKELTCGLSFPSRGNCCEPKSSVFV